MKIKIVGALEPLTAPPLEVWLIPCKNGAVRLMAARTGEPIPLLSLRPNGTLYRCTLSPRALGLQTAYLRLGSTASYPCAHDRCVLQEELYGYTEAA